MTRRQHRAARQLAPLVAMCALTAALPGCDRKGPPSVLESPGALPPFAPEPVASSTAARAALLHAQGREALDKGALKAALGPLTEATTLDPSQALIRLDLARLYALGGRPEPALTLLEPMSKHVDICGECVDALRRARDEPAFAPWAAEPAWQAVLSRAPDEPLPWQNWAKMTRDALGLGEPGPVVRMIHPKVAWTLERSCPGCPLERQQQSVSRSLSGAMMALKTVTRFNPKVTKLGLVKAVGGTKPTCTVGGEHGAQDRCCTFDAPAAPSDDEATLARVCFRPIQPDRPAITHLTLRYGPTRAGEKRPSE